MNSQTIREFLKREPFQPFAIILSNGARHENRHPEFALVSPSRLVVIDPETDDFSLIPIIHVAEIRMLQPNAA